MQRSSKTTYLRKIYKSYLGIFITFVTISLLSGLACNSSTHAESTSVNASATVMEACSVESTGSDHTATIVAGNYDQIGDDTVFNINCNDNDGYVIYAVGNSNDEEGNTNLIGSNSSSDPSSLDSPENSYLIRTGTATEGEVSNWSFKLSNPSQDVVIEPGYDNYSVIPTRKTAVIKRSAGTTSPTVDSFHASYSAYVSKTQPVDTYQGKVKYILFHPSTTIVTYYTITYNTNGGTPDIETQTGNTTDSTITLSPTSPTKNEYTFDGWCTIDPGTSETCSGDKYNANEPYPLAKGANVTLYATWKAILPQNCGGTIKLRDGKTWCKNDSSQSVTWYEAKNICNIGKWHLPTIDEFNTLLRAYYPSAHHGTSSNPYYRYDGDTSTFIAEWGTTGYYWSSTIYAPEPDFVHDFRVFSTGLYADNSGYKLTDGSINKTRCVSS